MKKTMPRQIIIKLLKTQDKQKSSQRKMTSYTRGTTGFSSVILKSRRHFPCLKEKKNLAAQNSIPSEESLQELRQKSSWPEDLHYKTNDVLWVEEK